MTASHRGSRAWALITIFVGLAVAYPFLRKNSKIDSVSSDVLTDAGGSTHQSASVQSLDTDTHTPAITMATHPVDARNLPSTEFLHQPLRVGLPDWARRQSRLDELIAGGPSSQAGEPSLEGMSEIPTWTDPFTEEPQLQNPLNEVVVELEPFEAGQASSDQMLAVRSSPWEQQRHSSINSSQNENSRGYGESTQNKWPEQLLATRQFQERIHQQELQGRLAYGDAPGNAAAANGQAHLASQHKPLASRATIRAGPLQAASAVSGSSHHGQAINHAGSLMASPVQPVFQAADGGWQTAARKRHFVYQPGYLPDG